MTGANQIHELSGAFVLHALDEHEAARFDRHLSECPDCRAEVRALRSAAAAMGAAEPHEPPARLRDRVLEAAARTRQLPPSDPAGAGPAPAPPRARPADARLRRVSAWVAGAAAAAVLVAVAVLGAVVPGPDEPALAAEVVQVFDAPDAQTATVATDNGGRIRVATSAARDEMAVDTAGLPALEPGRVYQLWSVSDGAAAPAAVLDDPDRGAAMAMPERGTRVIVTIEPAGGSDQPTTEAIADVDPYAV